MNKRLFLPLTFGLSAVVACSLARTDIRVVATPVALPGPTLPPATPAADEALPTQVVPTVATPVISPGTADVYAEANLAGGLTLHYADPSTGRELTTTTIDGPGVVGYDTSVTIGADGLALIIYFDVGNNDLKVAHCANPFCTPYFRRR